MPNPATRFEYTGGFAPTTLANPMGPGDATYNVVAGTGAPTGAVGVFTMVINRGGVTEEKILNSSRATNAFNVAPSGRGYDGTVAQSHLAGETVELCWSAVAADADNLHNASTTGIHGVAGAVVGTSDIQTLTNKTLDGSANTFQNIPAAAIIASGGSVVSGSLATTVTITTSSTPFLTTTSLGVGTWLVNVVFVANVGSGSALDMVVNWVDGTATVTSATGATAAVASFTGVSTVNGNLVFVAVVAVAGTVVFQASVPSTTAKILGADQGFGNITGYTALKVA